MEQKRFVVRMSFVINIKKRKIENHDMQSVSLTFSLQCDKIWQNWKYSRVEWEFFFWWILLARYFFRKMKKKKIELSDAGACIRAALSLSWFSFCFVFAFLSHWIKKRGIKFHTGTGAASRLHSESSSIDCESWAYLYESPDQPLLTGNYSRFENQFFNLWQLNWGRYSIFSNHRQTIPPFESKCTCHIVVVNELNNAISSFHFRMICRLSLLFELCLTPTTIVCDSSSARGQ